jgi:hypothetical protein
MKNHPKNLNSLDLAYFLFIMFFFILPNKSHALSFLKTLDKNINKSSLVQEAQSNIKSSEYLTSAAKGKWFPTLHLSAYAGNAKTENIFRRTPKENVSIKERVLDVSLSQPLLDFGKTASQIKMAQVVEKDSYNQLEKSKSEYIKAVLSQYFKLRLEILTLEQLQRRNAQRIKAAENSVRFKPDFTSLEQLKFDAKKAERDSDLLIGIYGQNLSSLLGIDLKEINLWETIKFPKNSKPSSLEEGIKLAEHTATRFLPIESTDPKILQELSNEKWADSTYPKVSAEFGYKYDENHFQHPVLGSQSETYGIIKFQYDFETGLSGVHNALSLQEKSKKAQALIDDQVRLFRDGFIQSWLKYESNQKLNSPLTEFECNIQLVEMLFYTGRLNQDFLKSIIE